MKLINARKAALETANAYDAALAEMKKFVVLVSTGLDMVFADRSDRWHHIPDDHPPKAAFKRMQSYWYAASTSLEPARFASITKMQIVTLDLLLD